MQGLISCVNYQSRLSGFISLCSCVFPNHPDLAINVALDAKRVVLCVGYLGRHSRCADSTESGKLTS